MATIAELEARIERLEAFQRAGLFQIYSTVGKLVAQWAPNGDMKFGTDVLTPANTYIVIFDEAQVYNGESFDVGDMLFGDNSAGVANMVWKRAQGVLQFRGGQTVHAYIDATGELRAGGGRVRLTSTGFESHASGVSDVSTRWYNSGASGRPNGSGFVVLQPGDSYHSTLDGQLDLGYEADANNTSQLAFVPGVISAIVKYAGVWYFPLDVLTDHVNFNGFLAVTDGVTAPAADGGFARIYVDAADGDLKVKFSDGVVKTLATDT